MKLLLTCAILAMMAAKSLQVSPQNEDFDLDHRRGSLGKPAMVTAFRIFSQTLYAMHNFDTVYHRLLAWLCSPKIWRL